MLPAAEGTSRLEATSRDDARADGEHTAGHTAASPAKGGDGLEPCAGGEASATALCRGGGAGSGVSSGVETGLFGLSAVCIDADMALDGRERKLLEEAIRGASRAQRLYRQKVRPNPELCTRAERIDSHAYVEIALGVQHSEHSMIA